VHRERRGLFCVYLSWGDETGVGHDQLFKEFLRAFLRDFLKLFFPKAAARINFTTVRFLDKELFTDFPEGSLRQADLVSQVETREGAAELILIHLEVQPA